MALYGLIPAAGSGARLAAQQPDSQGPKQYLQICGRPMLAHTLRALLSHAEMKTVFIVLAPDDKRYAQLDWSEFGDRVAPLYCGGATRRDSVFNGLIATRNVVEPDEWVLVHDAARPCLGREELGRLIEAARDDEVGGLLAVPLADTLKREDGAQRIAATEPREQLWLAQTPQMFRHGTLLRALDGAKHVTDEAAAVEALGLRPRLVEGSTRNLKVTYADDVAIAESLLRSVS